MDIIHIHVQWIDKILNIFLKIEKNIKIAFQRSNKINNIIANKVEHINKYDRKGIYKFICTKFNKFYKNIAIKTHKTEEISRWKMHIKELMKYNEIFWHSQSCLSIKRGWMYVNLHSPSSDWQRVLWVSIYLIIFHVVFYMNLSSGDLLIFYNGYSIFISIFMFSTCFSTNFTYRGWIKILKLSSKNRQTSFMQKGSSDSRIML